MIVAKKTEAKPKRKRRTKAEMEAAREAESQSSKPKQKRKRRPKAEIEAARAASLPPEPKWYEIGYKGPKPPPPKPKKKPRSYSPPPPRQKFDTSLIDKQIKFPGGAKYAITKETKHGRHVLSWGMGDWSILYNARYNNTEKHWQFYLDLYKRTCDNGKNEKTKKVKNNGTANATTKSSVKSGRTNTKGNPTRKSTTSGVRKGRRNSKSNALHDKPEDRAVA